MTKATIENFKPRVRRVGVAIFTRCISCDTEITIDVSATDNPDVVTCPDCGITFDRIEKKEVEKNGG